MLELPRLVGTFLWLIAKSDSDDTLPIDDPLMKSDLLPYQEAEASPHVMLVLTLQGGHIGWYTRESGRMTQWFVRPICEYFEGLAKVCAV